VSIHWAKDSVDLQDRTGYEVAEASVLRLEGNYEQALAAAERAMKTSRAFGLAGVVTVVKLAVVEALQSAFALGRLDRVRELLAEIEALKQGHQPPMLRAYAAKFRALLGEEPEQRFRSAAATFNEYGMTFEAAAVQLEHGEWLVAAARPDEAAPLLDEARETFERIDATRWVERARSAAGVEAVPG
jgi:hypothetical protein